MRKLISAVGMVVILIVAFVVVQRATPQRATPPQSAQPKITWTIPQYETTVFPGTLNPADLNFTSDKDVVNASVFVTPSISAFLSIASPGAGVLAGGQKATLHAIVTIPAPTAVGTYEGTLHIRSGNATVAVPLAVVIHVVRPSNAVIPSGVARPSPDRIITTAGGATLVKDEVDVVLNDNTVNPDGVIRNIASSTGGVIIGSVPDGLTYQLQFNVSDLQALDKIRAEISVLPNVEAAIFSVFGGPSTLLNLPNDPLSYGISAPFENRWGLEYIKATAAWALQTGDINAKDPNARPVAVVGVIDLDFDPEHSDLKANIADSTGARTFLGGSGSV